MTHRYILFNSYIIVKKYKKIQFFYQRNLKFIYTGQLNLKKIYLIYLDITFDMSKFSGKL